MSEPVEITSYGKLEPGDRFHMVDNETTPDVEHIFREHEYLVTDHGDGPGYLFVELHSGATSWSAPNVYVAKLLRKPEVSGT